MVDSHKWGLIPNKNRKPIELPKSFQTLKTDLEVGDIIIFSTLMLHRSLSAEFPRMSLTAQIKILKIKIFQFLMST